MSKILVVDDEDKIRLIIRKYAEAENYEVDEAKDGMEALLKVRANNYDLVILDVIMPDMDGFESCRSIRELKKIPVIMISSRNDEQDKIRGFELGIDDYVIKPFSPRELMMRIKVVISRNLRVTVPAEPHDVYTIKGMTVDFTGRSVSIDGKKIDFTPKEYELLFYLVKNRGIALTRDKLINEVWGYDYYGDDRTLDTHIKLIRKNLGEYRKHLVTLRGIGYKFEV